MRLVENLYSIIKICTYVVQGQVRNTIPPRVTFPSPVDILCDFFLQCRVGMVLQEAAAEVWGVRWRRRRHRRVGQFTFIEIACNVLLAASVSRTRIRIWSRIWSRFLPSPSSSCPLPLCPLPSFSVCAFLQFFSPSSFFHSVYFCILRHSYGASFVCRQLILLMAQSAVQFILMVAVVLQWSQPPPPTSRTLPKFHHLRVNFTNLIFHFQWRQTAPSEDLGILLPHCIHSFLWICEIESDIVRFAVGTCWHWNVLFESSVWCLSPNHPPYCGFHLVVDGHWQVLWAGSFSICF